ncbi:MAG: succinylglutamate desuccinylase/aspartoacylase family protein [Okeania sp. SIO3I5]|uniref:succinylglutamate desuccinylase/aspartoacylase family protein n=1 Tax=Okeania sp. SIO3I5 TaxID=2607805 RepID=UPI0013B72235|nr:succinylglutamate desuccinylase/aspartoacylase family protein [Okeania sp. SIO3I5]NEQ39476.1 succinylglutamate desuccinylase/aspartoacylase family protein [Okeania sp. SIO3I5]
MIEIGGSVIPLAKRQLIEIPIARLPTQTLITLPVTVINGSDRGSILWLSAAIHGDEVNGIEIIRQVLQKISPSLLKGTLIAVPIVNIFGFIEQSRYLPDRRDLNRSFPGSKRGSLASRLARLFMEEIVSKSTHGIDLHTASYHRKNLPQIRANLHDPETYECANAFAAPVTIHSQSRDGSLREAAAKQGIPTLLYEAGEALRFDENAIQVGVEGIMRVMASLNMYPREIYPEPQPVLEVNQTKWVRSARGGILRLYVELGQKVMKKQLLGVISDAFGEQNTTVNAPCAGMVIGSLQNPLVNQGDAIVHLAVLEE